MELLGALAMLLQALRSVWVEVLSYTKDAAFGPRESEACCAVFGAEKPVPPFWRVMK
jgi:hypothetical protein